MAALRRHDLLEIDGKAWDGVLHAHTSLAGLNGEAARLAERWGRCRWPVIVRRRDATDRACDIPAALPLPPCVGRQRLAFGLAAGTAFRHPPVSLCEAAGAAPDAWQPAIARLIRLGEQVEVRPLLFGALLWQHVTGLSYLGPRSDLDLLWAVPDHATAALVIEGLHRIEKAGPVRLDGELTLPDGAGVNWRELSRAFDDPDGRVLVKTIDGVESRALAGLFDGTGVPA